MIETIVITLGVCLFLCWMHINRIALADALSPVSLLLVFWVCPLILNLLNLSGLQTGLSSETWLLLLAVSILMTGICGAPIWFFGGTREQPKSQRLLNPSICRFEGLVVLVLAYGISIAALLIVEFQDGVPLFDYAAAVAAAADLHRVGKDSRWGVVAQASLILGPLCFYVGLTHPRKVARTLFITLGLAVPAIGILKASKSDFFIPLLYCVAIYYYVRQAAGTPMRLGRMAIVATLIVSILIAITSLRLSGLENAEALSYAALIEFKYRDAWPFPVSESAAMIYGYTALNFQNLSNFIDHETGEYRIGISLLRPLFSVIMQGDVSDQMVVPPFDRYYVSPAATVGTFLRDLYMEGGILFCLVGAAIYASFINLLYIAFRKTRSPIWMLLYINFLLPWTWIFFQNAFATLTYYINAVVLFGLFALTSILRRANYSVARRAHVTGQSS